MQTYTFETIPSKYSVPFGGNESLNRTRSETTSILGKDAIDDNKYQLVSFHTQTEEGKTLHFPSFYNDEDLQATPQDSGRVSGRSKYSLIVQLRYI